MQGAPDGEPEEAGAVAAGGDAPAVTMPSSLGSPPPIVVGGPVLAGPVTIHGGSGVVSPARYSNRPRNAGVPPSQCCSNQMLAERSEPSASKVASSTPKRP